MDKDKFDFFFDITNLTSGIDRWTLGVALGLVLLKIGLRRYLKITPCMSRNLCGSDLLNGVVIVPFATMVGSVFSAEIMNYSHNGTLMNGIAGGIGLIFVAGEIFSFPPKPREATKA